MGVTGLSEAPHIRGATPPFSSGTTSISMTRANLAKPGLSEHARPVGITPVQWHCMPRPCGPSATSVSAATSRSETLLPEALPEALSEALPEAACCSRGPARCRPRPWACARRTGALAGLRSAYAPLGHASDATRQQSAWCSQHDVWLTQLGLLCLGGGSTQGWVRGSTGLRARWAGCVRVRWSASEAGQSGASRAG